MTNIIRHGRERVSRGILQSFNDLPLDKQGIFKIIKKEINDFNINHEIFVFGSYYWGFWDEESDYDVLVNHHEDSYNTIMHNLKVKYGLSVHIMTMKNKNKGILIP